MKKSIKRYELFLFLLFSIFSIQQYTAQETKSEFWSNVQFGGGIGLGFGNGYFSGTLAPSAIYHVNDRFSAGVGLNGTYASEKHVYKSYIVGGSVLGLFNVIPEIQLSGELETLHVSRVYDSQFLLEDDNYWVPALFLGAGYRTGGITVGLRYDVLFDEFKSVYGSAFSPFVRVYF